MRKDKAYCIIHRRMSGENGHDGDDDKKKGKK